MRWITRRVEESSGHFCVRLLNYIDWYFSEVKETMAENLMNKDHKSTTESYRREYDRIFKKGSSKPGRKKKGRVGEKA